MARAEVIAAFAPSERAMYGEFYHRPQAMLKRAGIVVNDERGVPRIFRDAVEAQRFARLA